MFVSPAPCTAGWRGTKPTPLSLTAKRTVFRSRHSRSRASDVFAGVLGDVLQRLEAAVVDGGLAVLGQPPDVLEVEGERDDGAPRDLAERRVEAVVGEERRIDAVRGRAEVVERIVEVRRELCEPAVERAVVCEVAGELELDSQRDELLLHAVMEIPLDLAPFRRGGSHEPPLRRAQRVHRVEQIVFQPAILERQERGGSDGLDELGIVAQRVVVDERQNLGLAVPEHAPGERLERRIESEGRPVPVDELLAPRQPEEQLGLRIVEHAPYELLDGGDRRASHELTGHERERLACVGAGEEQACDEPQREEDARAREDRAGGVRRLNAREVEERRVQREGHDEGGGREEDRQQQAAPRVARPQESSREVEEQARPPRQAGAAPSIWRKVSAAPGASTASAALAGHAPTQLRMPVSPTTFGDTSSSGSSPTRKVATAIPITTLAAPPRREPGKTSNSQVAPSAEAQTPSIPTR